MSDLTERWRKGRVEFYTEDEMYSIGDEMAFELEVAKAREEAWVQFAQHHHSCAGRMPKSLDAPWRKCTCGLDALKLAAWRSRQGRRGRETDTGTRLAGRDR